MMCKKLGSKQHFHVQVMQVIPSHGNLDWVFRSSDVGVMLGLVQEMYKDLCIQICTLPTCCLILFIFSSASSANLRPTKLLQLLADISLKIHHFHSGELHFAPETLNSIPTAATAD